MELRPPPCPEDLALIERAAAGLRPGGVPPRVLLAGGRPVVIAGRGLVALLEACAPAETTAAHLPLMAAGGDADAVVYDEADFAALAAFVPQAEPVLPLGDDAFLRALETGIMPDNIED